MEATESSRLEGTVVRPFQLPPPVLPGVSYGGTFVPGVFVVPPLQCPIHSPLPVVPSPPSGLVG